MSLEIRNSVRKLFVANASRFDEPTELDIAVNTVSVALNEMIEAFLTNATEAEARALDIEIAEINKAAPEAKIALIEKIVARLSK